jgi:hypothetical protein
VAWSEQAFEIAFLSGSLVAFAAEPGCAAPMKILGLHALPPAVGAAASTL